MLTALTIQNFGLIQKASLTLPAGLAVLTGETGAGKSMLTGALSFCLGEKMEIKGYAPQGKTGDLTTLSAPSCMVEATFSLPPNSPVAAIVAEMGLELEEGDLILRRQWAEGKSKAFANGARLTQAMLQQLAPELVDLHSQHDQQLLMNDKNHQNLLDVFGHLQAPVQAVKTAYQAWRHHQKNLEATQARQDGKEREEILLRAFVEELEALAYQPDEEQQLETEKKAQLAGEQITHAVQEATEALDGEQGALIGLSRAEQAMRQAGEKAEGDVATLAQNLWEVYNQALDLSREVARLGDNFSPNPNRLAEVDDRLNALRDCARKHKTSVENLPELQQKFTEDLAALESLQNDISALKKQTAEAYQEFVATCATLSKQRKKTAAEMESKVEQALGQLKMSGTSFLVVFTPLETPGKDGAESVSFHVAPNAGMRPAPLSQVASGGEISRLMLALKTVFYADLPPMTLIFDEVDTGIGGAVADAVGQALKQLSTRHQVLAITHQPQVAAKGSTHLLIEKQSQKNSTQTRVSALDFAGRQAEIARMLSGQTITAEAQKAAESLLKEAR